jgi:transcriptional regulator with XRE-family HTH domain
LTKRINQALPEGIDGNPRERLMADIRGHIRSFKGTYRELADLARLSVSTVSNIACGDTKSPHLITAFQIMDALGKSDPILDAFRSESPVSLRVAQRLKAQRAKRKLKRKEKIHPHRVVRVRHGGPLMEVRSRRVGTVH